MTNTIPMFELNRSHLQEFGQFRSHGVNISAKIFVLGGIPNFAFDEFCLQANSRPQLTASIDVSNHLCSI